MKKTKKKNKLSLYNIIGLILWGLIIINAIIPIIICFLLGFKLKIDIK